ncbi:putative helicase mov-10-B.1 [Diretmus argenteus]
MPIRNRGEYLKRVGVSFIEFLKEDDQRRSITDQKQLKQIYTNEFRLFRVRNGYKHPDFGPVLHALNSSGKAKISSGNIYFKGAQVCLDQQQQQETSSQDKGPGTANGQTNHSQDKPQTAGKAGKKKTKGDHGFNKDKPVILGPGEICEIDVHFHTTQPGVYRAFLQFKIEHPDRPIAGVCIVRSLEVTYRTSLGQELTQTAPAKACSIPPETSYVPTIVKGQRPERLPNMNLKPEVPLKEYNVPDYIDKLMKALNGIIAGSSIGKLSRDKDFFRVMVESPLTWKNYSQKLHLLLFLEEVQLERDMKKYNMVDVPLVRDEDDTKLFLLQVSDSDASLLRGQQVLVRPSEEPEDPEGVRYQGFIHHVDEDQAQLSFGKEFMDRFIEGMTFSVEFVVNRLTMRVEHRAVEFASLYSLKEVLFPAEDPISYKSKKTSTPSLFNSQLKENREQYQAIKHIVAGSSIPAPYLVFGPPGTGKTVTVVEAILQIERKQASCHILACAPSNSAADLLWGRLLDGMEDKDKDKVFRMYAYSHSGVIPQKRQRYCNKKTGSIVIPSKEELMQYKIMVTTLQTASRLVTGGIPTGFYTHIFVDEAGCAPETTCIIPLSGLLNPETGQVVLAGDPKQLGPIIHSCLADKYGMGVSLLERLMSDVPLYKKKMKKDKGERFNKRFITKLLKNYRSHPDILKIPNDLFYEGELQFCADEKMRNSYCGWKYLPMKDFPVIFHRVVGTNEQESDSPSLFNIAEVEVLMDYLKILVCGQRKTKPRNIGIIATYRKQVEKIHKALEIVDKDLGGKNLEDITVGTVEEFQGKESQVILLSTVRSRPKGMIKKNQKISLGFVKNDKDIPLRGHRETSLKEGAPKADADHDPPSLNRGNFQELFKFMCKYDPTIKTRLEELPRNATLMSSDIQNELLESAATLLLRKIKAEVSETPGTYYALMADEYKDESKRELVAVCVRYLHAGKIKERAIGFMDTSDMSANGISEKI